MSKHLLPLGFLAVFLGAAVAAPGGAWGAEEQATNYVSIETTAAGEPMLVVDYPWSVHKNATIEVRTYVAGEEDSARIRPLQFHHTYMKDSVTITVYDVQAGGAETRTTAEFLRGSIQFQALGQRNLLNRPAVCVTCETEVLKPNKEAFPDRARWAIYPFLEPWAADRDTLFLSLPEETFAAPVKIRVFLLRDGHLLWSESEPWPGLPGYTPQPAAKQPARPAGPEAVEKAPAVGPAAGPAEPAQPAAQPAANPFGP